MAGLLFCWLAATLVIPERQALTNTYLIFLLLPFLVSLQGDDLVRLAQSHVLRAAAIFLLVLYASIAWNSPTALRTFTSYGYNGLLNFSFLMLLTYLLQKDARFASRLFVWLGCVAVLIGAASFLNRCCFGGMPSPRFQVGHWSNVNTGSAILGLIIAGLLAGPFAQSKGAVRLIVGTLAVCLLALLVATASRSPMAGLLCAVIAIAFFSDSRRLVLTMLLAVFAIGLGALMLGAIDVEWWLIRADGERISVWSHYARLALDRPLAGHGIQNEWAFKFGTNDSPHNMLVSAAFYGGIPGGAAFLLLMCTALLVAATQAMRTKDSLPLALATYLVVHGLFESVLPFHRASWAWIYLWLPLAAAAACRFPEAESRGQSGDKQARGQVVKEDAGSSRPP